MRPCDHCGTSYTPKRSTSKYCKSECRIAAHLARKAGRTTANLAVITTADPTGAPLTDATRIELGHLAETADGVLLLTLAARIDAVPETSPALASLSKEYAARKTEMLSRTQAKADPFDELQALRARRRA